MLSTSGNQLNSVNTSNVNNNNSNTNQNKSNLLSASNLINSEFMLPINNLTTNNMANSSYLNDYNKFYGRDGGMFQQPQQTKQQNNLMNNQSLNNLVVNNLTNNLNNLGNHNLQHNNLTNNNLNGLPNQLNQLQQQQSNNQTNKLISNSDFMLYLNRCNQLLELNLYQQALDEINQALNLVSNSAIARFRKAQALLGLKRFYDCEKELWNCISLEPNVIEYRKELLKVKQLALMSLDLNLDQNAILMAAQKYDSIKEAVDALMWSNNMMNFNYQTATNNLNETNLMNGWNNQTANNRFGNTNFNTLGNQLVNNGNNLLFNNSLISNNNLLLNNTNLINRSNNGTNSLTNVPVTSCGLITANKNINTTQANQQTSTNSTVNLNNNNQNSTSNQQQSSNSPLTNNNQNNLNDNSNNNSNLITNGLSNVNLSNGNNRFNYLLRSLDQTHLSTNGQQQNNNQQQQIFNRLMPTFIDSNNSNVNSLNDSNKNHGQTSTSLTNKLNLNENSILNGTSGLLLNNNSAPSPICAKLNTNNTNNANNNSNSSSTSLTNSCNYNIFNQMPEMKLIETIVPNLLTLGSTSSINNSITTSTNNQTTANLINNDLINNNNSTVNDLTSNNLSNKLLESLAKEVNNNVKDNLVDSYNNNNQQINQQQQTNLTTANNKETTFDDCNKSANNKKTGKLNDLNNLTNDNTTNKLADTGVLDLKNVIVNSTTQLNNNSKNELTNNLINLNNINLIDENNDKQSLSSSNNQTAASMQSTSYSDIVKRAKKISQQNNTNTNGNHNLIGITKQDNLITNSKLENEVSDDNLAKRPTNLWAYNGLRVANVSLTASKSALTNLFSKFGRIRLLERIVNKTTTNNIWVYYDNPISPVDAVTKLQNVYLENICVDSDSPLRLFFAPTDDQKDLKFSRPKQPPDNKGECYYWRTTNCFSKDQCPLLHIQANKNIDAQVWMKIKPEDNEAVPASSNQVNAENSNGESASES